MQRTTLGSARDSKPAHMPFTKNGDDDSGLHDLKALASSTKQRRSRRMTSELDAQNSLLQSAASLEAVALPDPNKEQPMSLAAVAIADAPLATPSTATATTAQETGTPAFASLEKPQSSGKYLLVGFGLVAAAAAAFYVMRGAGSDDQGAAAPATAVAQEAPAIAPLEEPTPVVADEVVADEVVADEVVANEVVADEVVADEVVADEAVADEAPVKDTGKKSDNSEKRVKATNSDEPAEAVVAAKAEKPAPAKEEKKAAKSDQKAPTLGEGGTSLDDVLSSVTGGIDKPIASEKADDTPSKKRLERGDVAKAMKSITPAAKGCYATEEYSGTVIVKYSVGPDGSITKAAATGAHKSSKTGQCVVSAVKNAKFPAFSGSTQSFSFPFLLSP